jgi:hypothetical protein
VLRPLAESRLPVQVELPGCPEDGFRLRWPDGGDGPLERHEGRDLLLDALCRRGVALGEHVLRVEDAPICADELRGMLQEDYAYARSEFPAPVAVSAAIGLVVDQDAVLRPLGDDVPPELVRMAQRRAARFGAETLELRVPARRARPTAAAIDQLRVALVAAKREVDPGEVGSPRPGELRVHLPTADDEWPELLRTELVTAGRSVPMGWWPSLETARRVASGLTEHEQAVLHQLWFLARLVYTGHDEVAREVGPDVAEHLLPALRHVDLRYEGVPVEVVLDPDPREAPARRALCAWPLLGLVLDDELRLRPAT